MTEEHPPEPRPRWTIAFTIPPALIGTTQGEQYMADQATAALTDANNAGITITGDPHIVTDNRYRDPHAVDPDELLTLEAATAAGLNTTRPDAILVTMHWQ